MRVLHEMTLTNRQVRMVDKWRRGNHRFSDHAFGDSHEKFVRIPMDPPVSAHQKAVERHVGKLGFTPHDYHAGLAKDRHGREVRIGKILSKAGNQKLLAKFNNDPARAQQTAHKDHEIVITRHPHHVAGMTSCDHPWTGSCMHISAGVNRKFLKKDLLHGTHVAYLVHKDDKYIRKPLARVAIKPFEAHSITGKSKKPDPDKKILQADPTVYGNAPTGFHSAVVRWTNKHFPLSDKHVYRQHPALYQQRNAHDLQVMTPRVAGKLAASHVKNIKSADDVGQRQSEFAGVARRLSASGADRVRKLLTQGNHGHTEYANRILNSHAPMSRRTFETQLHAASQTTLGKMDTRLGDNSALTKSQVFRLAKSGIAPSAHHPVMGTHGNKVVHQLIKSNAHPAVLARVAWKPSISGRVKGHLLRHRDEDVFHAATTHLDNATHGQLAYVAKRDPATLLQRTSRFTGGKRRKVAELAMKHLDRGIATALVRHEIDSHHRKDAHPSAFLKPHHIHKLAAHLSTKLATVDSEHAGEDSTTRHYLKDTYIGHLTSLSRLPTAKKRTEKLIVGTLSKHAKTFRDNYGEWRFVPKD